MRSIKKVFYYINLWGLRLTFFKVLGRLRFLFIFPPSIKQEVLIIGCGQFSFSTLMPNILKYNLLSPVKYAYDINKNNLSTFCRTFSCKPLVTIDSINKKDIKLAYVCSNHSSHFLYTCKLLKNNIDVYCEKPLTTSLDQVHQLAKLIKVCNSKLYAGYNRPHSPVTLKVKKIFLETEPKNLNVLCSIYGHYLSDDHWYRDPNQGSRIYGNLAHWIDLANHMMLWLNETPKKISIHLNYLDAKYSDENLICTIKASNNFNMILNFFAKCEPFLGVHETIEVSSSGFNARVKNFKILEIETQNKYEKINYRKKNAGHRQAIIQPSSSTYRNPNEILMSEILISIVKDMTSKRSEYFEFDYLQEYSKLIDIY